jgi:peptidoglycan/LPS O-acetylase OafA/YrhL
MQMGDDIPREDATPESAAVTGGLPPAAEPPPTTRGRAASAASSTLVLLLLGIVLLLTAAIADQDSDNAIGMAVLGVALLGIGAMSISGLAGPVLVAVLGFVAGVLATIVAFSTSDFRYPQLILLICGAAAFIASFASLAASRRPGRGAEEPRAGVESI